MAEEKRYILHTTKAKIDKAAYAKALIYRGEFDWSGTQWENAKHPPRHNDGSPRAPVEILLKAGGWAITNTSALSYLSMDYFDKRFAWHMQRMDGGFRQALAELTEDGDALQQLNGALFASLMDDLKDPERCKRIPFAQRATLYTQVTELEAKLKGDSKTRGAGPQALNIGGILQIVNNNVEDEDPESAAKMRRALKSAHSDVSDIIEGVVEVADSDD